MFPMFRLSFFMTSLDPHTGIMLANGRWCTWGVPRHAWLRRCVWWCTDGFCLCNHSVRSRAEDFGKISSAVFFAFAQRPCEYMRILPPLQVMGNHGFDMLQLTGHWLIAPPFYPGMQTNWMARHDVAGGTWRNSVSSAADERKEFQFPVQRVAGFRQSPSPRKLRCWWIPEKGVPICQQYIQTIIQKQQKLQQPRPSKFYLFRTCVSWGVGNRCSKGAAFFEGPWLWIGDLWSGCLRLLDPKVTNNSKWPFKSFQFQ